MLFMLEDKNFALNANGELEKKALADIDYEGIKNVAYAVTAICAAIIAGAAVSAAALL